VSWRLPRNCSWGWTVRTCRSGPLLPQSAIWSSGMDSLRMISIESHTRMRACFTPQSLLERAMCWMRSEVLRKGRTPAERSSILEFPFSFSKLTDAIFGFRIWRRRNIWRSAIHVPIELISITPFEFTQIAHRLRGRRSGMRTAFAWKKGQRREIVMSVQPRMSDLRRFPRNKALVRQRLH
jgi:hypothetical protein